jgi:16S rRNA (adenine1518-N6/adenine1519-N6)-dimethyltransferase
MHIPRKRFGQHFLRNDVVIDRIITALAPAATDHLVEIGPGLGALTIPVLKVAKELEVVEIDYELAHMLPERSLGFGKLHIHCADVLKFDFSTLYRDRQRMRIFGNLPYNISTPLLFHLIKYASVISDMLFMVQKEVAERMAAPVASDAYGRLSVMIQYHYQTTLLFSVSANAFQPQPRVESAIIQLKPYEQKPYVAVNYDLFAKIVLAAFNHRRKTLRNSLKPLIEDSDWAHIDLQPTLRPEQVSLGQFVAMSNIIAHKQAVI